MLKVASTIIVARRPKTEANNNVFQVLFVKRHDRARFMPSAHVFPGGVHEDSDENSRWRKCFPTTCQQSSSQSSSSSLSLGQKSKVAVIRELFEEANILLAQHSNGDPVCSSVTTEWRKRVQKEDKLFLEMCETLDLQLQIDGLSHWGRWLTPPQKYRYDTSFFFSTIENAHPQLAIQDGSEVVETEWLTPHEALRAHAQGSISLRLPTWINTFRLSQFSHLNELLDSLKKGPNLAPIGFKPNTIPQKDGGYLFLLPGDPQYPLDENEEFNSCRGENPSAQQHRAIVFSNGKIEYHINGEVFDSSKF